MKSITIFWLTIGRELNLKSKKADVTLIAIFFQKPTKLGSEADRKLNEKFHICLVILMVLCLFIQY